MRSAQDGAVICRTIPGSPRAFHGAELAGSSRSCAACSSRATSRPRAHRPPAHSLYARVRRSYARPMNEALPGWLSALREDAGLAGDLGVRWLDAEARRALHAGATGVLETQGDENWNKRGLERIERCVPLALGPERSKRLSKVGCSTALFFDPMRPEHVSLSLAASMSPLTWAEAPATVEGVR